MIDRYTLVNTSYVLKTFKNDGENFEPIYNAYPTKKLPIITLSKNDEISNFFWGSTRDMSKNNSLASRLINVDISKVKRSNVLFNQFKFDRCLIPCDGFYFWKKLNTKEKTPYYFKYIKDKLMYCAGIREKYEDFSGNRFYHFSFLTSSSSSEWKAFSNNSPLIVDMRYFDIWFDRKSSYDKIYPFLSAIKFSHFNNYTVSPFFDTKNSNDPSLIEPKDSLNQYGNYSLFD